jgi:hypothetical protein|nr:MAG TPA: hypothetical protein [Caudoviricetes sp.]
MYKHICKECGKSYTSYHEKSSFCSLDCSKKFRHAEFLRNSQKMINQKFGKLTVIDIIIENNRTKCLCVCDCGKKLWVESGSLKNCHTSSCGCFQKDKAKMNIPYLQKYRDKNLIENTHLDKISSSIQKNNTSGIKGVYFHSSSQKWVAKLTFQKHTYLKEFKNKDDAIKYRKELEEKYFKPILEKYKAD